MDMKIETPKVPNFIRVTVGAVETTQPVCDFTDEQLSEVAKAWTLALFGVKNRMLADKDQKKGLS